MEPNGWPRLMARARLLHSCPPAESAELGPVVFARPALS